MKRFVGVKPDGTEEWEEFEVPLDFGDLPELTEEKYREMLRKCQSGELLSEAENAAKAAFESAKKGRR